MESKWVSPENVLYIFIIRWSGGPNASFHRRNFCQNPTPISGNPCPFLSCFCHGNHASKLTQFWRLQQNNEFEDLFSCCIILKNHAIRTFSQSCNILRKRIFFLFYISFSKKLPCNFIKSSISNKNFSVRFSIINTKIVADQLIVIDSIDNGKLKPSYRDYHFNESPMDCNTAPVAFTCSATCDAKFDIAKAFRLLHNRSTQLYWKA